MWYVLRQVDTEFIKVQEEGVTEWLVKAPLEKCFLIQYNFTEHLLSAKDYGYRFYILYTPL